MNVLNGWKFYNHALLPTTPPHHEPNLEYLKNDRLWTSSCFLVRYTTDFDCGYETEWWWLIKDDEMDIEKLKKKRRYEISKGLSNSDVRRISPMEFANQLYSVYLDAFQGYRSGGQAQHKESFLTMCIEHDKNSQIEYYAVFDKESGEMAGYALNHVFDDYVSFTTMKFSPKYLSKKTSAALVYTMLCDYLNTQNKKYVSDGERSIRHVTNFQDYLIKYFGFRKAYCKLHVWYRPSVGNAIKVLYPFRKIISKVSTISLFHSVSSLLDMEGIKRSFK